MIFRFLTSGESHGKALNAIIEGVPSGLKIDSDFINFELAKRQSGYGRGARMQIEKDTVEILSGVRHGYSTGSPICLQIKNNDWENWTIAMSSDSIEQTSANIDIINSKKITNVRPGHADFAGAIKYNHKDVRNILERSSARETAARVAVGAVAKCLLKEFGIESISYVTQIGTVFAEIPDEPFSVRDCIENSDLRTYSDSSYEKMKSEINSAGLNGDTLGGSFKVIFKNVPVGLGSHVQWDRKLDGKLSQAVMSIQAIKAVEFGLGHNVAQTLGSKTHDEIYFSDGKYIRKTNNSGGIEGGISNGENIVITAYMKAIPTMKKPLNSVEIDTRKQVQAHFERSDVCAVPACSVVAEAMCAIVLADEICEKFSHDSIDEMLRNFNSYKDQVSLR